MQAASTTAAPLAGQPETLLCPINLTAPRDGVWLPGEPQVVYEREAVAAWLLHNPSSPMTRRRYARQVPLLPVDARARTTYLRLPPPATPPPSAGAIMVGLGSIGAGLCLGAAAWAHARDSELVCCLFLGGALAAASLARRGWQMVDAELRGALAGALAGLFVQALEGAWPA